MKIERHLVVHSEMRRHGAADIRVELRDDPIDPSHSAAVTLYVANPAEAEFLRIGRRFVLQLIPLDDD
jgi:hypothetical protein